MPCFLFVYSWSQLPSQPDALQPGCILPWPAAVPSAAPRPAAAHRSSPKQGLPRPARLQPGFQWIVGSSHTLSAT